LVGIKCAWTEAMKEYLNTGGRPWAGKHEKPYVALWVPEKYRERLEELQSSGVLQPAKETDPVVWIGYAEVPKSDGRTARAIGNCREGNKCFGSPHRFRLATPREIQEVLGAFPHIWVITGDFRHWFYQLELSKGGRVLGMRCGTSRYKFRVWCMGFAHSPWYAQAVTLTLAVWTLQAAGFEVLTQGNGDRLPPVLSFGRGGKTMGHFVSWYDNYMWVIGSVVVRDAIRARWNDVIRRFKVVVKEQTESVDSAVFGGIEYVKREGRLWWRHAEKNILAWKAFEETAKGGEGSGRELAGILGTILWDVRVSGDRLGRYFDEITGVTDLLSPCYEEAESWSQKIEWPELASKLAEQLTRIGDNPWREATIHDVKRQSMTWARARSGCLGLGRPPPFFLSPG